MRILLDECIDRRLADSFGTLDIKTVPGMSWSGISNGELLNLAEKEFTVFLRLDRNISFQQPVTKFDLSVLIMRAISNRLVDLQPIVPKIIEIMPKLKSGEVVWVDL